jgi:hypothetical protein
MTVLSDTNLSQPRKISQRIIYALTSVLQGHREQRSYVPQNRTPAHYRAEIAKAHACTCTGYGSCTRCERIFKDVFRG